MKLKNILSLLIVILLLPVMAKTVEPGRVDPRQMPGPGQAATRNIDTDITEDNTCSYNRIIVTNKREKITERVHTRAYRAGCYFVATTLGVSGAGIAIAGALTQPYSWPGIVGGGIVAGSGAGFADYECNNIRTHRNGVQDYNVVIGYRVWTIHIWEERNFYNRCERRREGYWVNHYY